MVTDTKDIANGVDAGDAPGASTSHIPAGSPVSPVPSAPVLTSAWTADSIRDEDWQVSINPAARRELDIIADALSDHDGPLDGIEPHGFDWPAMTELMTDVRQRLTDGCGFVLLDRMGSRNGTTGRAAPSHGC